MKNAFVIVTLSGLLAACAAVPPQPASAPSPPAAEQAEEVAVIPSSAEEAPETEPAEVLPNVPLTSELLYKLMKAELEFRKGNWKPAYAANMSAARQTRDPRLARRAAEMAITSRQTGESMAAIGLWRELAPESDEAAQYYLGFALLSDDLAHAEEMLRQRLREASRARRGLIMYQTQQLLARAKDKAAAAALLERLVAPYGDMAESHVALAQAAFAAGDAPRALREAEAALAIQPDSEIAVLTLAQVTADEAQVAAVLEKFLVVHPGAREVRAAHARVLVNQKQYDRARQQFLVLLKDQPDDLGTLYALGIMSMQLHDYPGAEQHLTRFMAVLAAKPDDERDPARVIMILAQLAEERRDFKAALGWLDKITAGDEAAQFSAQIKRAQLLGKQGDLAGARTLLAGLAPSEPSEQARVVLAHGQILREAGKLEEAYALMAEGARRFPANPDLLYDFALLAEKTGRLDVMEKALREVMARAPDNHHAYNALGYSLAERNVRLQEALALIDKALKLAPGDPFIMDSMGWVQFRLGNLNEAEAQLRRAYQLRSDPEIAVHLGEVLWHKGQKAAAQQLWREARAKDPKNDTLRTTLARLQLSL